MQDAPPFNVAVTDVVIGNVLPFLGASCGIEIRVEGPYALKFSVLDDKTIVVTRR